MKQICLLIFQVAPRTGRRGRPPKHPVNSSAEVQAAAAAAAGGAEPELAASNTVEMQDAAAAAETTAPLASDGGCAQVQAPARSGAAEGQHTCSECGASFARRYLLIMHTLKHEKARGYKCSVRVFIFPPSLLRSPPLGETQNVLTVLLMFCHHQLCSKEFQYPASLRAHLVRHKQQSSQRAPLGKAAAAAVAGGAVGGENDLDERALSPHTKREFVCDICGKTLPKLYSLRIHMLNHTGVRPHSCKVCHKTFAHKNSLKMHRALHDATKQFQCEYCQKCFVSKRSMEEHTSMHTGRCLGPQGRSDSGRGRTGNGFCAGMLVSHHNLTITLLFKGLG